MSNRDFEIDKKNFFQTSILYFKISQRIKINKKTKN